MHHAAFGLLHQVSRVGSQAIRQSAASIAMEALALPPRLWVPLPPSIGSGVEQLQRKDQRASRKDIATSEAHFRKRTSRHTQRHQD